MLDENRFLAARDGMDAELVDPRTPSRVPARAQAEELLEMARPYARRLGCVDELELVGRLIDEPSAERQRAFARGAGLPGVVPALAGVFCDSWAASPGNGPMVVG